MPCFLHCGESFKRDNFNVLDAVLLKSRRIGHAIQMLNTPKMADMLREADVCVECNPISNYKLGFVRDLRTHPTRFLL